MLYLLEDSSGNLSTYIVVNTATNLTGGWRMRADRAIYSFEHYKKISFPLTKKYIRRYVTLCKGETLAELKLHLLIKG